MGVNSLLKAVTRQRRDCDLSPSAPESSTLTTRLSSHPSMHNGKTILQWITDNWRQALEGRRRLCRLPEKCRDNWHAASPRESALAPHVLNAASCEHTGSWFQPSFVCWKHVHNHMLIICVSTYKKTNYPQSRIEVRPTALLSMPILTLTLTLKHATIKVRG